jgi:hypothetical protein
MALFSVIKWPSFELTKTLVRDSLLTAHGINGHQAA